MLTNVEAQGSRPQQRFALIDALRGIAALAVVFYHAYEGGHITGLLALLPTWVAALLKHGALGVPVFFVLSGFVISHSVVRSRVTFSFVGRFMLRRSIRLDPPYWFAIILAISFAYLSARVVAGKELPTFTFGQVTAHFFYLQEILGYPEINPIFWTLCQEVQFYLVYVLLLALSRNDPALPLQGRATAMALAVAALVSLLWPLGILDEGPYPGSFLPMWHGFLVGVGAYWAWRYPAIAPYYIAYSAVLLIAGLWRGDAFVTICVVTAFGLWKASVLGHLFSALNWRWIQVLGAISYSLYLTHNPITGASFRIGYMLTGRSPVLEAVWWVLASLACIVFAYGVWWLIERPSIGLARRVWIGPGQPEPPSAERASAVSRIM
jgi:peptidoglycan/LPS O-acetylase OafA/YrhL